MTDKRASQRQRTFKAGSIVFNYAAGIDCIVKNRSAVGAMIEVESQLGVPDFLCSSSIVTRFGSHVVWYGARAIELVLNLVSVLLDP